MDPIDLESYRIQPGNGPQPLKRQKQPRQWAGSWFLRGPIPGEWLGKAAALGGRALHVALAVCHAAAMERSDQARLTRKVLQRFGVKADAGRRGLAALERAGLVAVERHAGRCPTVSIVKGRQSDS